MAESSHKEDHLHPTMHVLCPKLVNERRQALFLGETWHYSRAVFDLSADLLAFTRG